MHEKIDILNSEILEDVTEDIIKIFGSTDNEYLNKNECRNILNIIIH